MKKTKSKPKTKKKNAEWKGFDDCAICQAMKNGKADSFDGLMEAFDKQNIKNGHMAMRVQNKNDLYYDAMDALNVDDYDSAEKMLLKAKEMDSDYVQTYVGLVSVYGRPKDKNKALENIKIAFDKVLKKFPKWPKKIEWGVLENRAYLRAIQYRADIYGDEGEKEKAIELYRLLLKLNPNDNQGVRYVLSGMYAGISGEEVNKMFDEGNKKQNWNKLEKLVEVQNKKYKFWDEPKD
ncbi:MAG: hypothetical protein WCS89_02150 [Candidatus Paceibacterota bacterium]|jgi:tetratricopeptide (TPR) repeat protein